MFAPLIVEFGIRAEAYERLKTSLSVAVDTLQELLNSSSDYVKLRAAQFILDYSLKIADTQELEERVSDLGKLVMRRKAI